MEFPDQTETETVDDLDVTCDSVRVVRGEDEGVLSDSAVEWSVRRGRREGGDPVTALSDTEMVVKDRLSSKLWEWSAARRSAQVSGIACKMYIILQVHVHVHVSISTYR